ncbi:MAG: GNAT family N-acetyltransferase [Acidimicrobiia bacterium]|nr:GNAT family N-acetyltransferase [Acidimicrobiia bacterium]
MPIGTHPSVTIRLRDSETIRVRPVTSTDRDQLARGFLGLSEASRYQRFFTPLTKLSGQQLAYLTDLDHIDHFAWGIESEDGDGVAIARYVKTGPAIAEAAFTVADNYQGLGLGWTLMQALALVADHRKFKQFEMTMLADNGAMAHLARKAGARFEAPIDGVMRAELDITPSIWVGLAEAGSLIGLATDAAQRA